MWSSTAVSGAGGRDGGLGRVEHELQVERAEALTRIATTLEGLVEQLHGLRRRFQATASPGERGRLSEAYVQTRREALRYRWYLEVQREAIGLTRHAILDEHYALPQSLADHSWPGGQASD